ncbi:MAG: glycosyltransferase [Chromatiaceae bacterium]|nr:glycosyltransferase [Chromatiaceae bacterium]MCF8002727.1 glycosyltransferase [Chromatiaceae bacterium]
MPERIPEIKAEIGHPGQTDEPRCSKRRPLRVLQVYRTYFPDPQGGLQEAIRQGCLATRPLGIQHRIFTLSPTASPQVIRRPEGAVYRARQHIEITSSGFSLSAIAPFRALVGWADVVHYHFPWPFADLLDLFAQVRKPKLVTYHSDIVRQRGLLQFYRPLMNRFLASADRIIATSPAYADSSQTLQAYRHKLEIIPLALDEHVYPQPTPAQTQSITTRFGQDYFLFIGVLRYYKGLDTLLQAVAGSPIRVVIAGEGPEGTKLQQLARERFMSNVHFAGIVSDADKVALIQNCRAIVFPSNARSEAFGITLLEGAMFGRPLICTELGTGTTYINQHNQTGLVVSPNDAVALRQAMLLLAADREYADRLGQAARARFQQLFSSQMFGTRLAGLYQQLVKTPPFA